MLLPKQAVLTPCAGRCSTVFGDAVCRGCRRFNHEVIEWNRYDEAQKTIIWQRLDRQLDQILLPLLPHHRLEQIEAFLNSKKIKIYPSAGAGRQLYHALKICEKIPHLAVESGLGLEPAAVRPVWQQFEQRVLQLAQAEYELAWVRAYAVQGDRYLEHETGTRLSENNSDE